MEATIKETVKNIFKTHAFEEAVALTENCRGEYIHEFGVKSWNSLVTYYKHANITPEPVMVAEPLAEYPVREVELTDTESVAIESENVDSSEINNSVDGEITDKTKINEDKQQDSQELDIVPYMLYQNAGDKVNWYGHFVNYKGLKVGDEDWMIRMNNLGVGMGRVIAAAQMTLPEINIFHKCYAVIRANTQSDNSRVMLFKRAFNNLQEAMKDPAFVTKTKSKDICDFVLNYDSNK